MKLKIITIIVFLLASCSAPSAAEGAAKVCWVGQYRPGQFGTYTPGKPGHLDNQGKCVIDAKK